MVKMFYITFLMRRYGSVWWAFSLPKFETICTIWSYVIVAYSCCMVMIYVWLFLTLVIWIWWQVGLHRLCQRIAYHYLVYCVFPQGQDDAAEAAGKRLVQILRGVTIDAQPSGERYFDYK